MKNHLFIFLLFIFVFFPICSQTYQVKVHYKNGQVVNAGSSNTVQRVSTGYAYTTMYPSVWITEQICDRSAKDWKYVGTMVLGSDQDIESISFIPEEESKTIYQYLEDAGIYTYTLRLLNELGYAARLRRDIENFTLFVANDDQWRLFFASTKSPVKNYEELTRKQKMALLKLFAYSNPESRFSAVSSDYNVLQGGKAFRKADLLNYNDTSYIAASELPKNSYWDALRQQGGTFLSHPSLDTSLSVVFTNKAFENLTIKEDDVISLLGDSYEPDARIYFFDTPIQSEVQCRNGYIYELSELAFTPQTLDEELHKIKDCSLFSSFLDRFAIPVKLGEKEGRSIYRKGYFAEKGTYALQKDPEGNDQSRLLYDPAWRNGSYVEKTSSQEDMAVVFVPTNEALEKWWNSSVGRLMMKGYNNWEEVPNELLSLLINNHMKTSFLQSNSSNLDEILNDGGYKQGIRKEDIVGKYMANNAMIYVVNKVYTPDSHIPVWSPCLKEDDFKVMRWAIFNTDKTKYNPDGYATYLNSREHRFSFVMPSDAALMDYVDPTYVSKDGSYRRISFTPSTYEVVATSTIVDKEGVPSELVTTLNNEKTYSLLKDILKSCVIVMNGEDWSEGGYYKTMGGSYLNISGFRQGATVLSGGNIEKAEKPEISQIYNQSNILLDEKSGTGGNGVAMAVTVAIQPTLNSVSELLKKYPEFSEFRNLLVGSDEVLKDYFKDVISSSRYQDSLNLYQALYLPKSRTAESASLISRDLKVCFLGDYNYTLYVPTNKAMQEAYAQGLPRWEDLESLPNPGKDGGWNSTNEKGAALQKRKMMARKIMDFIRFHFQYTSLCMDRRQDGHYKTCAFRAKESVPYELGVYGYSGNWEVYSTSTPDSKAKIIPSLSNLMAREYLFDKELSTATKITSSSYLVVHGIDAPLFFSAKGAGGIRDQFK